jgi:hypothetical protein
MADSIGIDKILGNSSDYSYCGGLSIKSLVFLFITIIFVLSTAFSNYILKAIKGAMSSDQITSYGTMIQAICIVLIYALIDCLKYNNIL